MGLEYAPVCRVCGRRKTKNADQVCSQCARLTCTSVCSVCGNTGRRLYKGLCSGCRNAAQTQRVARHLSDVIVDLQKTVTVLEHLNAGESYAEAGAAAGISKSAAYDRARRSLPQRAFRGFEKDAGLESTAHCYHPKE